MEYIASNKIEVFPSTKRGEFQKSAKLLSESNLIKLVNQLLDMNSFVITPIYGGSTPFEMNIGGYYFKIPLGSDITGLYPSAVVGQSIVAIISVQPISNNIYELVGQDEDNIYKSLKFDLQTTVDTDTRSEETIENKTTYTLRILDKVNGSWSIPSEAQVKFSSRSIEEIDGGLIT